MVNLSATITRRKDGRYMGKFIVGYDDNGKAQYQYVYGRTYDEAEGKVLIGREVVSRYLSGRYITVSKIYDEWLNAVVNRVKESTFANYISKFEKHILPEFADIPCADLSAGRINEFVSKKLSEGLSASYVGDILTVFKSMLKYAQEEYNFKLSLKNVVLPKAEKKQIGKISDTEQKKLVFYLRKNMSLTAFCILISLFMGLRIGELCGLKWSDVDFDNNYYNFHHHYNYTDNNYYNFHHYYNYTNNNYNDFYHHYIHIIHIINDINNIIHHIIHHNIHCDRI